MSRAPFARRPEARSRALVALIALGLGAIVTERRASAEDYVTVRGAYYREPSTRVIQPTVEVERDSPTGWDVRAHFLVDTITSASVSAGTTADSIFTETRNEVGLSIRRRWDRSEVVASYRYSAESDYWSHAVAVTGAQRFWGDSARISASMGLSLDTASSRFRTPECAVAPSHSCALDTLYFGLSYTQILSPVLLGQLSAESTDLDGFQGNLYRTVRDHGYERVPSQRLRNAVAMRLAYYVPAASLALRLHYRYYFDVFPGPVEPVNPWRLASHMFELRAYRPLTHDLTVRVSYRQYIQNWSANFWCQDVPTQPSCYAAGSVYFTSDPKLGHVYTAYPELELIWQAEAIRPVPVLGWLAPGTFTVSYGHYFQNTSFGNAHVLQAGYTLPY